MTKLLTPISVEVTRGSLVESNHLVDLVVSDCSGGILLAAGEPERIVFPRSAVKSFQALPLVESGAADAFGFTPQQIALACSSHNGEQFHVKAAADMLAKTGLDHTHLECGCHAPMSAAEAERLHRSGEEINALHNNCSGKHSGMLAFARHTGLAGEKYIERDHPVQKEVTAVLQSLTGAHYGEDNCGRDGCSIPTYAVPLDKLALAAARFASQSGMSLSQSKAAKRILNACCDHPEMVAGTDRACTEIIRATGRAASVKVGAEGVYLAMLPEKGLGIALKARDGATRAGEAVIASILQPLLELSAYCDNRLSKIENQTLKNHNKFEVGEVRVATESKKAITQSITGS